MSRLFIELQVKSNSLQASQTLWDIARLCIHASEAGGFHTDLLDERFAGTTQDWTFLVLLVTGQGAPALLNDVLAQPEASNQRLVSTVLLVESDCAQTEIDPSELSVSYYRREGPSSRMISLTDCNVELRHVQSGVVVRSQSDRSRAVNYANALSLLRCHLQSSIRSLDFQQSNASSA